MKAVVRKKYGPPEVLRIESVRRPDPGPDELLIKVHASTVNRTDCGVLTGEPFIFRFFAGFPNPRFESTGTDFAGVVVGLGKNVTGFREGDRVFGFNDEGIGSHREFMVVRADQAIRAIPHGISFADAAASIEGFHYAFNFMSKVRMREGDRILVNGATGAIGSAALQVLIHQKMQVTAVCGTNHVDLIRALGPEKVIDYETADFTKETTRFSFVFDAVGKSSFTRCKHLLLEKGVYISSELGDRCENPFWALITPFLGGRKVIFPIPVKIKRSLDAVSELLASGAFRPLIDRSYPLDQIAEAFRYVARGQKIGNVILTIADT